MLARGQRLRSSALACVMQVVQSDGGMSALHRPRPKSWSGFRPNVEVLNPVLGVLRVRWVMSLSTLDVYAGVFLVFVGFEQMWWKGKAAKVIWRRNNGRKSIGKGDMVSVVDFDVGWSWILCCVFSGENLGSMVDFFSGLR